MEDINILNGLILASITAAVCAAGFFSGRKKRLAQEGQDQQTEGGMK